MRSFAGWLAPLALGGVGCVVIFGCGGGGGGPHGTTTASTSTATTSTSGATGTVYAANTIIYGLPNSGGTAFDVDQITPTGSSNSTLISGVSSSVVLFAQVPGSSGQFVFAAALDASGNFGIYSSKNLNTASPTVLVSPTYSEVDSLTVTSDGKHIVYTAVSAPAGGAANLYVMSTSGGKPSSYGAADGAAVSPADSNTILYVAPSGSSGLDQVFTRSLGAGSSGSTKALTSDGANHALPAFNRAGTQVAYWAESGSTNILTLQTLSNGAIATLPNPAGLVPLGESFSADGTQIGIAADASGVGEILTQPVDGSAAPTPILTNSAVELGNYGIYWTDSTGRGISGSMMINGVRRLHLKK